MEGRRGTPDLEGLEEKLGEIERLVDSLGDVPDEELVGTLNWAVELLREINAGIEMRLDAAREGSREIGALIERLDLGPFDEALKELERQEHDAGETGVP